MDGLYRGIETSLLVLSLTLGVVAAAMPGLPSGSTATAEIATTLPMISVSAAEPAE